MSTPKIDERLIFGSPEPNVRYRYRRAAYVVIADNDGNVAMVKGARGVSERPNAFLPGGGSLPGEALEDTVTREVMEELAQSVRLICKLARVTQYFYSDTDDQYYKMLATIFAGEFTDEPGSIGNAESESGEHELHWLPITEACEACFHACHAWAVRRFASC